MDIYTKSFKHNRKIYKKISLLEKIIDFLNRHESATTIISVIILAVFIFFMSVAFGNPVTDNIEKIAS